MQTTFALHGVQLPRDAWQQASAGVPGDGDPLAAREGDLLFFSDRVDRHITHVAISLGHCAIVHLALGRGGFGIERLDDGSDRTWGGWWRGLRVRGECFELPLRVPSTEVAGTEYRLDAPGMRVWPSARTR